MLGKNTKYWMNSTDQEASVEGNGQTMFWFGIYLQAEWSKGKEQEQRGGCESKPGE